MKKNLLLLGLLLCMQYAVFAQSYSFTKSTGTYASLTSPTVLTSPGWDDDTHTVAIGFPFNYGGISYSSLVVDENGLLFFDYSNDIVMIPYFADLNESDIPGIATDVSYQTTGTPGSRIFKLQWQNAGFYDGITSDNVNFQVWLHEGSNKIETHFGQVSIANPVDVFWMGPVHGLILSYDFLNDTFSGPFLDGDPQNPVMINHVNDTLPATLLSYPTNGLVYTFSSLVSGVGKNLKTLSAHVYPNPVAGNLFIEGIIGNAAVTIKVYDVPGKLVMQQALTHSEKLQVDLTSLKAGTYLVEITSGNSQLVKRVVKL